MLITLIFYLILSLNLNKVWTWFFSFWVMVISRLIERFDFYFWSEKLSFFIFRGGIKLSLKVLQVSTMVKKLRFWNTLRRSYPEFRWVGASIVIAFRQDSVLVSIKCSSHSYSTNWEWRSLINRRLNEERMCKQPQAIGDGDR